MLTSKPILNLIKSHEQSIAKAKICRMTRVPQFQPLDRSVISSRDLNRILGPTNFEVVQELERRNEFIENIYDLNNTVTHGFISCMLTDICMLGDLTWEQISRLLARLKETFELLDRILDCAAIVRDEFALDPIPPYPSFGNAGLDRVIHRARQELITALSPLDLALLCLVDCFVHTTCDIDVIDGGGDDGNQCIAEVVFQTGSRGMYYISAPYRSAAHRTFYLPLLLHEAIKERSWDQGNRSEAPDWSPDGVLEPLVSVRRKAFRDKVRSIPGELFETLVAAAQEATEAGDVAGITEEFWLIGHWLRTQDTALEERPPIPQRSCKELFAWAVTQELRHGEASHSSNASSPGEEDADHSDSPSPQGET